MFFKLGLTRLDFSTLSLPAWASLLLCRICDQHLVPIDLCHYRGLVWDEIPPPVVMAALFIVANLYIPIVIDKFMAELGGLAEEPSSWAEGLVEALHNTARYEHRLRMEGDGAEHQKLLYQYGIMNLQGSARHWGPATFLRRMGLATKMSQGPSDAGVPEPKDFHHLHQLKALQVMFVIVFPILAVSDGTGALWPIQLKYMVRYGWLALVCNNMHCLAVFSIYWQALFLRVIRRMLFGSVISKNVWGSMEKLEVRLGNTQAYKLLADTRCTDELLRVLGPLRFPATAAAAPVFFEKWRGAIQRLGTWASLKSSQYLLPNILRKVWELISYRIPAATASEVLVQHIWADHGDHWKQVLLTVKLADLSRFTPHVWRLPMWSCLFGKVMATLDPRQIKAWLENPDTPNAFRDACARNNSIVSVTRTCISQYPMRVDLTGEDL